MPTHDETAAFWRDFRLLTLADQVRFDAKRREFILDLLAMERDAMHRFRPGLRVKAVRDARGLFEMTWARDGRALFSMGHPVVEGKRHIIWHRVGDHGILP